MREVFDGADAERKPKGLKELVHPVNDVAYKLFRETYPEQHMHLQVALGAAQRTFDRTTRQNVQHALRCVVRTVLEDPRLTPERDDYLAAYLDQEVAEMRGWLRQDSVTAVSRGLNIGLAVGAGAGTVLLAAPILWGVPVLHLMGVTLDCGNRWSLLGAFVAGGVGAFGAVLSVLVRLRLSVEQLACRQTVGQEKIVVPGRQLARSMRHEGVYRVLVGWILAVAVYFLLTGHIVPVFELPATTSEICPAPGHPGSAVKGTDFWGFWCAVGFVSGFNERWAFGILGRNSTAGSVTNSAANSATSRKTTSNPGA
jgi:hypothetical protein